MGTTHPRRVESFSFVSELPNCPQRARGSHTSYFEQAALTGGQSIEWAPQQLRPECAGE